ncbi:hypothetical protein ACT0JI_004294, partial [Cronobacter turicensis]
PHSVAGALCLPALQKSIVILWRVRFAYPPYKNSPSSCGGCASLNLPTKRHLHRRVGKRSAPTICVAPFNLPSETIAKNDSCSLSSSSLIIVLLIAHL